MARPARQGHKFAKRSSRWECRIRAGASLPSLSMIVSSPRRRPVLPLPRLGCRRVRPRSGFIRFAFLTVDVAVHDARFTDGEFVALRGAPFSNKMVRCSSPRPDTRIRRHRRCLPRAERRWSAILCRRSLDLAAVYEFAFRTRQRAQIVDKSIVSVGSSTLQHQQALGLSLSVMVTRRCRCLRCGNNHDVMASASSSGTRSKPLKPKLVDAALGDCCSSNT